VDREDLRRALSKSGSLQASKEPGTDDIKPKMSGDANRLVARPQSADSWIHDRLPERYQKAYKADFPDLQSTSGFIGGRSIWNPDGAGLFITGDSGVGKTHLAAAVLRNVLDKNKDKPVSAKWNSVPRLLLQLRETFNSGTGKYESMVVEAHTRPSVLVLDDLGAEKQTDWTGQSLYLIISERMDDMKPTIVTSNMPLDKINEVDRRLASRLGAMVYVKLTGKDRRIEE